MGGDVKDKILERMTAATKARNPVQVFNTIDKMLCWVPDSDFKQVFSDCAKMHRSCAGILTDLVSAVDVIVEILRHVFDQKAKNRRRGRERDIAAKGGATFEQVLNAAFQKFRHDLLSMVRKSTSSDVIVMRVYVEAMLESFWDSSGAGLSFSPHLIAQFEELGQC